MIELKKCPFCGGEANWFYSYAPKMHKYCTVVKCEMCSSQGKPYFGDEDPTENNWETNECLKAAVAWNMRTHDGLNQTESAAGRYGNGRMAR